MIPHSQNNHQMILRHNKMLREARTTFCERIVPVAAWIAIAIDTATFTCDDTIPQVYRVHFPISQIIECSLDASNPLCWTPQEAVEMVEQVDHTWSKIEAFVREKRTHIFRSGFIVLRTRRRKNSINK